MMGPFGREWPLAFYKDIYPQVEFFLIQVDKSKMYGNSSLNLTPLEEGFSSLGFERKHLSAILTWLPAGEHAK